MKLKYLLVIMLVGLVAFFSLGCSSSQMSSDSDTYAVSGQVVDDNGMGIPEVTLKFEGEKGSLGTVTTDENGNWSKSKLKGEVKITATNDLGYNFEPFTKTVTGPKSDITFTKIFTSKIPATTKVINKAGVNKNLIEVRENALVFDQMMGQVKSLAAGDVLVFGVTDLTPEGLLRKATKIRQANGNVIVETEQATLEDAVEEGSFDFSKGFSMANVQKTTNNVESVELRQSGSDSYDFETGFSEGGVILYDGDGDTTTTNDQIKAAGSIMFNFDLNITGTLHNGRIQTLKFTNTMERKDKLELTFGVAVDNYIADGLQTEKTIQTIHLNSITFTIGGVPVVVTPQIKINVGVNGDVYAEASTNVTRTSTMTSGVSYKYGDWYTIGSLDNNFNYNWPTVTAGVQAKGYIGPELECDVYGVAGPSGNLHGYLQFKSDSSSNYNWKLVGGLQAKAGFEFEVLSNTIASAKYTVIDWNKVLAKDGENELTVSYPEPLVAGIKTTFDGEAPADAAYVVASVDGYDLTDEDTGDEYLAVENGKYELNYTFSDSGRDRQLKVKAFDSNWNLLDTVEEKIDVYEKGYLDVNYVLSGKELNIHARALPPINHVIVSVDGYPLTNKLNDSTTTYIGDDGEFDFEYTFDQTGEDRYLVVNAFDEAGNSITQFKKYIDVKELEEQ